MAKQYGVSVGHWLIEWDFVLPPHPGAGYFAFLVRWANWYVLVNKGFADKGYKELAEKVYGGKSVV